MELVKLSERIFYLPSEEENDRPKLGYIKGDKYAVAVDAGNSAEHVEKFYNALLEQGMKLPDFTVITHWHWDHTFGMHAVSGKTIASSRTNEKLKEVMKWNWSEEAMRERLDTGIEIEMCDRCIRVEYPDRSKIKIIPSELELEGRLRLQLGGISCELITADSPHSRDSVFVYVPEEKTIFVGDADGEDYYDNNGKYEKHRLEAYKKLLKNINFETYVMGHGEPEKKEAIMEYLSCELDK